MKMVQSFAVLTLLLTLLGCSSGSDLEYLDARSSAQLEIPPDLTRTAVNEKFEIPDNFSDGTGETINKIPVLAQVDTLKLEGSEDFYWLSVEGPVDNLYQLIKVFWASEGYTLEKDDPVIGIMQTDWILKEEGTSKDDEGFLDSLFASDDLSASQDQFRTRLARDAGTDQTRIYISHRGTRYIHVTDSRQTEDDDPNNWGFRPSEPEFEVEMLSRLMIYLGMQRSEIDQQLADIKLFEPRASMHIDNSENETYLLVKSVQLQTWNRLMHELDRLDLEIVSADPSSGFSGDGVVFVNTKYEVEEKESGFFNSETKLVPKQVALVVSEEAHDLTRISIENLDGDFDESAEALEFLTIIYEKIK